MWDRMTVDVAEIASCGLGLDHGRVELVATDRRWAEAFGRLAANLREALAGAVEAVEHVGSTAVADLVAKPILDIAVGLTAGADVEGVVAALGSAGYEYRGDNGDDGGRLFVLDVRPLHRVAHIHVVHFGDARWYRYLEFRDRLRTDSAARADYAALKEQLARECPTDRRSYTAAKAGFIRRLLALDAAVEVPLVGGRTSAGVVRVADSVRRPTGPWTTTVHAYLRHLRAQGFEEAPEPLGLDDANREVLSDIQGETMAVAQHPRQACGSSIGPRLGGRTASLQDRGGQKLNAQRVEERVTVGREKQPPSCAGEGTGSDQDDA